MIGAFLLGVACSAQAPAPAPGPPPTPGPVAGDTLLVGVGFDPGNLNPIVAPYALSGVYIDSTQLGLVEREITPEGLGYRSALAESWAWSADGTALTYVLVPGLSWSDGHPLTTADVAFTYELIGDPAVASNWFDDAQQIAAVEVVDERTVTFRFVAAGNPVLLQGATIRGILPRHVLQDVDRATMRGAAYSRAPLANGPWRVAVWEAGQRLVLEPNPGTVARPRPHLDRIITKVLPEYSTRLLELKTGAIDLMTAIEPRDVAPLRRDHPHLTLRREEAAGMQYVGWNLKDPRFADPRVRRALTLAIDRERIIQAMYVVDGERFAQPCVGTVAPTLGPWFNDALRPLAHDAAAAAALFAEAGWKDTNADGTLDDGTSPFRIRLLVQGSSPALKDLGVHIQSDLRAAGVDLELQILEEGRFAYLARTGEFEAILWAFGKNPRVDPFIQWHSTGQYNWMGYADPETDRLIESARRTTDVAEAQRLVREVQARVHEAQPATFLFWEDEVNAIDGRFQDVQMNTFTFLERSELWWVPADRQKHR